MRHSKTFTIAILLGIMMTPSLMSAHSVYVLWRQGRVDSLCDSIATTYSDSTEIPFTTEYRYNRHGYETRWTDYDYGCVFENQETRVFSSKGNIKKITSWESPFSKSSKSVYKYDKKGNRILYMSYQKWDSKLEPWEKREYIYNDQDEIIKAISYSRETEGWEKSGESEFTYDKNGYMTSDLSYLFDKDGNKYLDRKEETTFDERGNLLSKISSIKVQGQTSMTNSKEEWTYSADNKEISHTSYRWENEQWVPSLKVESIYFYEVLATTMNYKYNGTDWFREDEDSTTLVLDTIQTDQGLQMTATTTIKVNAQLSFVFTTRTLHRPAKTNADSMLLIREESISNGPRNVRLFEYDDHDNMIIRKDIVYSKSEELIESETIEHYNQYGQTTSICEYEMGKLKKQQIYYYSDHRKWRPFQSIKNFSSWAIKSLLYLIAM